MTHVILFLSSANMVPNIIFEPYWAFPFATRPSYWVPLALFLLVQHLYLYQIPKLEKINTN